MAYLFLEGVIYILDQFQLFQHDQIYAIEWNEITISLPVLKFVYPFLTNDRFLRPVANINMNLN